MKLFLACLVAETNSFCPCPTGLGAFEEQGIRRSADDEADPMGMLPAIKAVREVARASGWTLDEGLCAAAQPLGPVVDSVYRDFRAEILAGIDAGGPYDGIVLLLHGAMMSETIDDCEGDLAAAIRLAVGTQTSIGMALDLHCHLTRRMRAEADLIVTYKEYPHTDIAETAARAASLVIGQAMGRIAPVSAVSPCPAMGLWPTTSHPLRAILDDMREHEQRGEILDASFIHGMAYGDVPAAGAQVLVTTHGDAATARRLADRWAAELYDRREEMTVRFASVEDMLDRLRAWRDAKPLAVADVADNPGGGAMGDSVFLLDALLTDGVDDVALGAIWDPGAVQICRDAGEGARLTLRIGGKSGPPAGCPLDIPVQVMACREQHSQDDFGARAALGPSAWVRVGGAFDIVLISRRQQVLGTDLFTGLGIALEHKRAIVVKSMQHFAASFGPVIGDVLHVTSPGLLRTDFEAIPFRRRSLEYWPRCEAPI